MRGSCSCYFTAGNVWSRWRAAFLWTGARSESAEHLSNRQRSHLSRKSLKPRWTHPLGADCCRLGIRQGERCLNLGPIFSQHGSQSHRTDSAFSPWGLWETDFSSRLCIYVKCAFWGMRQICKGFKSNVKAAITNFLKGAVHKEKHRIIPLFTDSHLKHLFVAAGAAL